MVLDGADRSIDLGRMHRGEDLRRRSMPRRVGHLCPLDDDGGEASGAVALDDHDIGRGEEDDDDVQEWEHVVEEVDFDLDDAWRESVRESTPNVNVDQACLQIMQLQQQVKELTEAVKRLSNEKNGGGLSSTGESSAGPSGSQ